VSPEAAGAAAAEVLIDVLLDVPIVAAAAPEPQAASSRQPSTGAVHVAADLRMVLIVRGCD
jgi:hypothetical protein